MATPAPAVPRANTARILASLIAGLVVWHAVHGFMSPLPEGLPPVWNAGPMVLALVAVALVWLRPPRWTTAALVLIAAVLGQAFVVFGDSEFARSVTAVLLSVLAVFYGWIYVILPLFAWRRGRWPTEPIPLTKFATDAAWPEALRRRLDALGALGFDARLMHVRAEGNATAVIVLLVHPKRAAVASVVHFGLGERVYASTSLADATRAPASADPQVVVTDTQPADVFPPLPERCVLLFPDAPTDTLLRQFDKVVPTSAKRPAPSDEALLTRWNSHMQRHDRFLVDEGYLSAQVHAGQRRYTMKGGYLTTWRTLWPWSARVRSRQLRNAQDALRAASGRGAA